MVRFLHSFIFIFIILAYVKGNDAAFDWSDDFSLKYQNAITSNDADLYRSLLLSQSEIDSLVLFLSHNYPNCLTDSEKNLNEQKFLDQFKQLGGKKIQLSKIEKLNVYEVMGCAGIEGAKLNLLFIYENNLKVYRALTFIKLPEKGYKLMFDIESIN